VPSGKLELETRPPRRASESGFGGSCATKVSLTVNPNSKVRGELVSRRHSETDSKRVRCCGTTATNRAPQPESYEESCSRGGTIGHNCGRELPGVQIWARRVRCASHF
jgi:hypothetical protein